jgi:PAS domain S-box-containing protein
VREAQTLLAIAGLLATPRDFTEALRQVCRELAAFTGAETVSAYVLDPAGEALRPLAAYRVPKEALAVLGTEAVPVDTAGFGESVFAGEVTWSDDIQRDPRFTSPLFRRFPHRSGLVIPVHEPGGVIGAFYLVWWSESRRFDASELATLKAIGQQVGLLLRNAQLLAETDRRRAEAEAAEARYRGLVEHVPVGVLRTTPAGEILDANPAFARLIGAQDLRMVREVRMPDLYVDPADRERFKTAVLRDGIVRDFTALLRRLDGATVWVQIQATAVADGDRLIYEGVLMDVTDRRRADEAERRAEVLRYVASLANAAAHEINNPLTVVMARLQLLRPQVAEDAEMTAKIKLALDAGRRIADIIARMGSIARLELIDGTEGSPMLDIRKSGSAHANPASGSASG